MNTELLVVEDLPIAASAGAVEATLNYVKKGGPRPRNYTYDPPPGVPRASGEVDARRVVVQDARRRRVVDALGLDRSGFELLQHASALSAPEAYADEARVRALYYPEAVELILRHTQAEKVLVFDHTLRDSIAVSGDARLREPVRRVHDDQTFDSAPNRVRRHLPPEEAAARLQRRFAIINLWRPIGAAVARDPLAYCDARSIAADDRVPSDLVYPDWVGETYSFAYNPAHRWYHVPQQRPDEPVLLKIYDSRTDGTARFTAHTSFDDPTSAADAPPRRSIELRALVFWSGV